MRVLSRCSHNSVPEASKTLRIHIKNELLFINIISVILILIISFFTVQILRIILGLPFILFFPGYTLIAALFPKKSDLDSIERVALSFGLSIAVVPLIGLILNYMPWGIRLYPILVSLTCFIAVMSAIAWYRRRGLADEERLSASLTLSLPGNKSSGTLDRALSVILIMAIMGTIGALIYVIATPKVGETFTEFYVLGLEGKAEGYPEQLAVGEEGRVILGITNHERETTGYTVNLSFGGTAERTIGPIELDHEETWEDTIEFVPQEACALTTLQEAVYQPYGPHLAVQTDIHVASIENLGPGDHIWIEEESAQIRHIDDHVITLTEALKEHHPRGAEVVELQKAEFLLHKIRQFGEESTPHTLFSLRLDNGEMNARVMNQGNQVSTYTIELRFEGNEARAPRIQSVGPAVLSANEEWTPTIEYSYSGEGPSKPAVSLFRDGDLLYREKASGAYPALHLWIDVKASAGG